MMRRWSSGALAALLLATALSAGFDAAAQGAGAGSDPDAAQAPNAAPPSAPAPTLGDAPEPPSVGRAPSGPPPEGASPSGPGPAPRSAPGVVGGDIGLGDFKELFIGRTVYFELLDGTPWGREYYVPSTQETVFLYWDGTCFEGRWEQVGPRYCFYYRDAPSCWLTFYEGPEIHVVSEDGMRQRVARIVDDEPLSCAPDILSGAPDAREAG